MLNSLLCLANFKLIVPVEAARSFVMAAKLELLAASTMVRPANGVELAASEAEEERELVWGGAVAAAARWRSPLCWPIVSSKELSFVRFMIQPSILRNSRSSVTFCQETLSVVEETASTMTSSGWPGSVPMPSATPV